MSKRRIQLLFLFPSLCWCMYSFMVQYLSCIFYRHSLAVRPYPSPLHCLPHCMEMSTNSITMPFEYGRACISALSGTSITCVATDLGFPTPDPSQNGSLEGLNKALIYHYRQLILQVILLGLPNQDVLIIYLFWRVSYIVTAYAFMIITSFLKRKMIKQ